MMEFVNGKDDIPYMKWKKKHVPNHQPDTMDPLHLESGITHCSDAMVSACDLLKDFLRNNSVPMTFFVEGSHWETLRGISWWEIVGNSC